MKKIVCALALMAAVSLPLGAQVIKKMEFRNQPIVDILLALAQAANVSLLPDDTVTGNASFYFSESPFEESLKVFLANYKLYYVKTDGIYYVSRIKSSYDSAKNTVSMVGEEVDIQLFIRALSKSIGKTILYDALPRASLTVNADSQPPDKILEMLIARFPEYRIDKKENSYYYVKKTQTETPNQPGASVGKPKLTRNGDLYTLSIDRAKYLDTLYALFGQAGKEYSLLSRNDANLENLYFADRDFESMLRLVLEQANADYIIHEGVYYVFEVQKRDILKKLKRTEILQLKNISAQELTGLLPSDLAGSNLFKVDKTTNSIILNGSGEEIDPIREFILSFDKPLAGLTYKKYDLKYVKAKDLIPLLPAKLLPVAPILLPEGNSFVALLPEEGSPELDRFIDSIDRKTGGYPVKLNYLKNEDFLKNLPPSVSKDDFVDTGVQGLIFFVGSEQKRDLFLSELSLIDKPKKLLSYDILVLQLIKSNSLEWSHKVTAKNATTSSAMLLTGVMESVLGLNVDALSLFGYQFSIELNLKLKEGKTHVITDTNLTAISGQKVKFQNTETYRYNNSSTDSNGDKTVVTKEITSGLIVALDGWVSGDDMVSVGVDATVSDRSTSDSSDTSGIPRTIEKIISTSVRTPSGVPVVIGGLVKRSKDKTYGKIPILGDIPFIGYLFKTANTEDVDTEVVIYLIPHVYDNERPDDGSIGRRMETYYADYVEAYR
jgi:general secretion pathway protein D